MKIRVKAYGTLARHLPQTGSSLGTEMEIPPGTCAEELLTRLGIRKGHGGVVILNGRILRMADEIPSGAEVRIFQSLHGG
jgi:sulfur carrier protein ThiS